MGKIIDAVERIVDDMIQAGNNLIEICKEVYEEIKEEKENKDDKDQH